MPESVTDRPTSSHECVFLLSKARTYYYDHEAIREGSNGDGRNRRSVWTVNTKPYSEAHFACWPPKLVTPMILAGSKQGDVVLDPFMGSGTTAQVAQDLGRNWIGVELNPSYTKLQDKRTAQLSLMGL